MSDYIKKLKHPVTGKIVKAHFADDCFGEHIYGYGFRKDGKDFNLKEYGNKDIEVEYFRKEELKQ